jgi:uncharacterized RDD family membrane protein YckC
MRPQSQFSHPLAAGAPCPRHPQAPAIDLCTRCGSFVCATCRQIGPDQLIYCETCLPRQLELADVGTRFVATLLDTLAIYGPIIFIAIGSPLAERMPGLGIILIGGGFLGVLAMLGLQLYFCATYSQSIGKRLLGIKVVRVDSSPASLGRIIFLRNLVPGLIGSLCGLFSLVDALFIFGEQRRCLHDHIADTIVVKV